MEFSENVIDTIRAYPYITYGEVYERVCYAMDENECGIDDVDRVLEYLLIAGDTDGTNLLRSIITDLCIDRIIVPRIHAMMAEKKMTPEVIAKVIYDMLCRHASSANYVIITVLATLRQYDLGKQVIPYILPDMLAKYTAPKYINETLAILWRDKNIGGDSGEPVTLYRGVCGHNQDIGTAYSYTTDYEVARQFAAGAVVADKSKCEMNPGQGKIYTVRVDPQYIIGRCDDRGEAEVMVLPPEAGGALMVDNIEYV